MTTDLQGSELTGIPLKILGEKNLECIIPGWLERLPSSLLYTTVGRVNLSVVLTTWAKGLVLSLHHGTSVRVQRLSFVIGEFQNPSA